MKQQRRNRVDRRAVHDVRAGVPQHGHHPVRYAPALVGQIVGLAVRGLDEGRQADRLLGDVGGAEHLPHHVPVEAVRHRGFTVVVLSAQALPQLAAYGAVHRPGVVPEHVLDVLPPALLEEGP